MQETPIDWEQRRYEIAKDLFVQHINFPGMRADEVTAQASVELADMLIKELKGNTEKDE